MADVLLRRIKFRTAEAACPPPLESSPSKSIARRLKFNNRLISMLYFPNIGGKIAS
jgi:hypothetical protein